MSKVTILITAETNEIRGSMIRAMREGDAEVIVQDSIKHPLFEDGSIDAVYCGTEKRVVIGAICPAYPPEQCQEPLSRRGRKSDRKRNRSNRWR